MNKKFYLILASIFCVLAIAAWAVLRGLSDPNASGPEVKISADDFEQLPEIDWRTLYSLNLKTGKAPEKLKAFDGKLVKIPGFVVPLTDNYSEVQEFLLVPDSQSCVHVPPPPPNLIVTVKLRKAVPADKVSNPSWVVGHFKIETTNSEFGDSAFKLDGIKLKKYEFDDEE